jgi:formamidopyrimidine-DNA glycosylase
VPELPEAEVLRRDLEREVVGQRVRGVEVRTAGVLQPWHRTRPEFSRLLVERRIGAVRRIGVILLLHLDEARTWVVDRGAPGSLHLERSEVALAAPTHAAVQHGADAWLHLTDTAKPVALRTGVLPTSDADTAAASATAPRVIDVLSDPPPWQDFARHLAAPDEPLRIGLSDPRRFVGLGPVYSDEILWEAGLRPDRLPSSLTAQEFRRLFRAAQEVLTAGMKAAGGGLDDADSDPLTDEDGAPAGHLNVHGREGQPCPRCRTTIERMRLNRTVVAHHCPRCMA